MPRDDLGAAASRASSLSTWAPAANVSARYGSWSAPKNPAPSAPSSPTLKSAARGRKRTTDPPGAHRPMSGFGGKSPRAALPSTHQPAPTLCNRHQRFASSLKEPMRGTRSILRDIEAAENRSMCSAEVLPMCLGKSPDQWTPSMRCGNNRETHNPTSGIKGIPILLANLFLLARLTPGPS